MLAKKYKHIIPLLLLLMVYTGCEKDEQTGQDKYSTEIVLQGYNSTLTMLGGSNSNNIGNSPSNKSNDFDQTNQQNNSDLDDEIPF